MGRNIRPCFHLKIHFFNNRLSEQNPFLNIERELKKDCYFIERVRIDYRNPSAHRGELSIISAQKCFNYIIDIEHMLKNMLEPMKI